MFISANDGDHELSVLDNETDEVMFQNVAEQANLARIEAEQMSALRSLKTNLFLLLMFLVPLLFFFFFRSKIELAFCCSLLFSIQKGVVTVFTTIANFGTVRVIIKTYWERIFKVSMKN